MSKSIKLKDNTFIDSTGITHDRSLLSGLLNTISSNISSIFTSITNINTKIADSGWVNITPSIGTWTYFQYRKVGNKVTLRGYATSLSGGSSAVTVATLPVEIRPSSQIIYFYGMFAGRRVVRWFAKNSDGAIGIDWVANLSDGAVYTTANWQFFEVEYFVD